MCLDIKLPCMPVPCTSLHVSIYVCDSLLHRNVTWWNGTCNMINGTSEYCSLSWRLLHSYIKVRNSWVSESVLSSLKIKSNQSLLPNMARGNDCCRTSFSLARNGWQLQPGIKLCGLCAAAECDSYWAIVVVNFISTKLLSLKERLTAYVTIVSSRFEACLGLQVCAVLFFLQECQ